MQPQVAAPKAQEAARRAGGSARAFLTYQPKIKPQAIVQFCRQLASFARVGVPITSAIDIFAEQARNRLLRQTYQAVAADIRRGIRLSDALAAHPAVFPRIVADMVRSAEVTGNLDVVLTQAAKHIEREAAARQRVRASMTYPIIVMCFALIIAVGIVLFVLPKFTALYASLNVKTPGILNAMLNLSDFINHNAWTLALIVVIVIVGLWIWARTESGRYVLDAVLVKLPGIAPLLQASMIEGFCRNLGNMLSAGVPIGQTYDVVISNVRNRVYRRTLQRVGPSLAAGEGIYRPLQASGIFPGAVIQMFRVGEETGTLDASLIEAADMYENELDYRLKRLTALLEPAMVVFVGLLVGFVAVTLITSIYSLAGGFNGG
ncbi:MAG: type II secretion system F family protein [Candidatus Dormibacteria bacterium]